MTKLIVLLLLLCIVCIIRSNNEYFVKRGRKPGGSKSSRSKLGGSKLGMKHRNPIDENRDAIKKTTKRSKPWWYVW